jgi:hypothetical protein
MFYLMLQNNMTNLCLRRNISGDIGVPNNLTFHLFRYPLAKTSRPMETENHHFYNRSSQKYSSFYSALLLLKFQNVNYKENCCIMSFILQ